MSKRQSLRQLLWRVDWRAARDAIANPRYCLNIEILLFQFFAWGIINRIGYLPGRWKKMSEYILSRGFILDFKSLLLSQFSMFWLEILSV